MTLHPLAGQPVPSDMLIDVARLEREYYERKPDPSDPRQLIRFGTSGHRGTSFDGTLTEGHILAITQAISDYRRSQGIDGPLYMGKDTHALSAVAQRTALEVLADSDAGRLARDPGPQPRAPGTPRRRHRRHPVTQPAGRRRLQVQSAQRRPGRHRRHRLGRGARQPVTPSRQHRGEACALGNGREGRDDP